MSENIPLPDLKNENSIYEFVCKKISGKLFRDPIKYFIDENCMSFIGLQENTFEQGQLFNEFNQFVENLLGEILTEGHLTQEMFILAAKKGLEDSKYKKYFEQLIAFSNYNYFKSMMTKRNLQVLKMAQAEMEKQEKNSKIQPTKEEIKEADDKEMQEALKMSLLCEEETKRIQAIEDEELRRAIEESLKDMQKNDNNKKPEETVKPPVKEAPKTEATKKGNLIDDDKDKKNNIVQGKLVLPPLFGAPRNFNNEEFKNLKYKESQKKTEDVKVEKINQKEQEKKADEIEMIKQTKLREYREMILKMQKEERETQAKESLSKEELTKLEGRKKLADMLKRNRMNKS